MFSAKFKSGGRKIRVHFLKSRELASPRTYFILSLSNFIYLGAVLNLRKTYLFYSTDTLMSDLWYIRKLTEIKKHIKLLSFRLYCYIGFAISMK